MISTVSDVCVRTVLVASMFPRLSTHYATASRLSFALTVLRCKSVWSDHICMHACGLHVCGLVRPPFGHLRCRPSWPPHTMNMKSAANSKRAGLLGVAGWTAKLGTTLAVQRFAPLRP